MPRRYAGTPLEGDYASLKRRRELARALTAQSLEPYQGTQVVTGHAVDDRWGQGLGKIGQAIIGAMSNKRADDDEAVLGEKFDIGRKEGLEKVIRSLTPEPENYVERNPSMKAPDYMSAGMELETNPYLKDSDIGKDLVAKAIGGQANRYPSYQFLPTAEGYARGNRRTGNIEQVEGDFLRSQDNPRLQGQLAGARGYAGEASKNQAALATKPQVERAVTQAKSDVDLAMKPEIKKQTDLAEREADKIIAKPKVDSSLSAQDAKTGMLDAEIDQAKDQASIWTTGFLGAGTSWVPGTPAHDLSNTLATIKSNIGFDKLQEMRNNSPTGGALGQVSEFENRLLQSVWGALEQSQSPPQFKDNLEKVRKQSQESWGRIKEAYKQDYNVEYKEAGRNAYTPPEGVSPELWGIMTPEEKSAWQ